MNYEFWNDSGTKNLTNEEKLFYIYIMTNESCNASGCYRLDIEKAKNELGMDKRTFMIYLDRLKSKMSYIESTQEIIIFDYYKFFWDTSKINSKKLRFYTEEIKHKPFKDYVLSTYNAVVNNDDIIDSVKNNLLEDISIENSKKNKDIHNLCRAVISYFNEKCGTRYSYLSDSICDLIAQRYNEGFVSFEDYKIVIDKKYFQWKDDKTMEQYIRPYTLFGDKFQNYLNEKDIRFEKTLRKKEDEEVINLWDSV